MPKSKQFSYDPERLAEDLYAIPLPLYDGSPVNAVVAIGDDGLWLIDGGLGTPECQRALRDGIQALGFTFPSDVRGLLITHGHGDHVGAAQAVLDNGGELLAHRVESTEGRHIGFDEAWLRRNGLPADGRGDRWRDFTWPEPTRLLEDGQTLRWGNLELEVVWCPGHTPGLVCLFEHQRSLLFTTDHVMRRAPAPLSIRHPTAANPVADYLGSVARLKALPARTVLPGHGRPFHHLHQRLTDIEAGIESQLDAICVALRSGPATAFELLQNVSALRDRRPVASRYEITLVLARLRYLECQGRVRPIETESRIEYGLSTAAGG